MNVADQYPDLADLWDPEASCWVIGPKGDLLVAVIPFAFTAGIVIGKLTFISFYVDRWCYATVESAIAAARAWDGEYPETEPAGWHRHPFSGRRVDENGRAYVAL